MLRNDAKKAIVYTVITFGHVFKVIVKYLVSTDGPKFKKLFLKAPSSSSKIRYPKINNTNMKKAIFGLKKIP